MQTDLLAIVKSLENFCDPKWLEKKDTTEKYINAWFMNADELIDFVFQNKVNTCYCHYFKAIYSLRQMNALLATNNGISNLKKNQRKELNARIEKEFIDYMREA